MSLPSLVRNASQPPSLAELQREVQLHLDSEFSDLDVLLGHAPSASHAGPSTSPMKRSGSKRKRRGLKEEIAYWEEKEGQAAKELEETTEILPKALEDAQGRLQALLSSAQSLSLERYKLADKLAGLVAELTSEDGGAVEVVGEGTPGGRTALEEMESLQGELGRLEAGLAWVTALEQVMLLSERTLDPRSHSPSPLAALPHYQALHELVDTLRDTLPEGLSLLGLLVEVRERTKAALKDILAKKMLDACEAIGWPLPVHYPDVPAAQRRAFERAFADMLYLQAADDAMRDPNERPPSWASGQGLYPLQAMVQPIALRFKYHFQGSRNTNRVDKPEWPFANILDSLHNHTPFLSTYVQPLLSSLSLPAHLRNISVQSEFALLLLPIPLAMLRSRIPRLLDHPALLAHTIYQTVVFDDAIRETGFVLENTSLGGEGREVARWEGLAGMVLKEEGWFDGWLNGEKKFAEAQLHEIISAQDAWDISDEVPEGDESVAENGARPTVSARQVKALFEQITDRYAPLPSLDHQLPFLLTIQFPLLQAYLSRISGSLDAFESLSSAFVRAVPGALSGNTRGGIHVDQQRLTGGKTGLERLLKAELSAGWINAALRGWADDAFFIEMSTDLRESLQLRWRLQSEPLIPESIRSGSSSNTLAAAASVFDVLSTKFEVLQHRAEDMIVRHVTVEVENDLKQHLTRRWDQSPSVSNERDPSPHLLSALTTYSTHLALLSATLSPLTSARLYRRTVSHISNHILQRGVFSGWSKFTASGGADLVRELGDWRHASRDALLGAGEGRFVGGEQAVEAPWRRLRDVGRLLALGDGDGREGEVTFGQAMAAGWSDGSESLKGFLDRAGIEGEMERSEVQAVLRRRVDCWR